MKTVFLFSVLAVALVVVSSAQTPILTLVANPPERGTITFTNQDCQGEKVLSVSMSSKPGWYLSELSFDPPINRDAPFDAPQAIRYVGCFGPPISFQSEQSREDLTTFTNYEAQFRVMSNATITITFRSAAPDIKGPPKDIATTPGMDAEFSVNAVGRAPLIYRWQKNGVDIAGATKTNLVLLNVQIGDSGEYAVIVSNALGTVPSPKAKLTVKPIVVSINNVAVEGTNYAALGPVTVKIQSQYANGRSFYTLDGSAPDLTKALYTSPFVVGSSATLRVVAYSPDFLQSVVSEPLSISSVPVYNLFVSSTCGGSVTVIPPEGPYALGTVVTVIARPETNWTFMGWVGSAAQSSLTNTITMNGPKSVTAMFGTTVSVTVTGNGSIAIVPSLPLHPCGTYTYLVPEPADGNYFVLWGNLSDAYDFPYGYGVYNPRPVISAAFAPLPANEFALTVIPDGPGDITVSSPTNRFKAGEVVTVRVFPEDGQTFLGWSGDASGTTNRLSVTMDRSKTITARFSRNLILNAHRFNSDTELTILSGAGDGYQLEASSDLIHWTPIRTATNYSIGTYFTDLEARTLPARFYRAVRVP